MDVFETCTPFLSSLRTHSVVFGLFAMPPNGRKHKPRKGQSDQLLECSRDDLEGSAEMERDEDDDSSESSDAESSDVEISGDESPDGKDSDDECDSEQDDEEDSDDDMNLLASKRKRTSGPESAAASLSSGSRTVFPESLLSASQNSSSSQKKVPKKPRSSPDSSLLGSQTLPFLTQMSSASQMSSSSQASSSSQISSSSQKKTQKKDKKNNGKSTKKKRKSTKTGKAWKKKTAKPKKKQRAHNKKKHAEDEDEDGEQDKEASDSEDSEIDWEEELEIRDGEGHYKALFKNLPPPNSKRAEQMGGVKNVFITGVENDIVPIPGDRVQFWKKLGANISWCSKTWREEVDKSTGGRVKLPKLRKSSIQAVIAMEIGTTTKKRHGHAAVHSERTKFWYHFQRLSADIRNPHRMLLDVRTAQAKGREDVHQNMVSYLVLPSRKQIDEGWIPYNYVLPKKLSAKVLAAQNDANMTTTELAELIEREPTIRCQQVFHYIKFALILPIQKLTLSCR